MHAGKTLPDALAAQAGNVPPFYASLVTAGIRSGRLGDVLATLTSYARAISELRATVINSLIYPTIILVLGFGLLLGLGAGPLAHSSRKSTRHFRLRLPATTEAVLHVVDHPYAYLVVPVVGALGIVVALKLWFSRNEKPAP